MSRHIATVSPSLSLWVSIETAARAVARRLAAPADGSAALAMLEREQALIRQSSRHWLVG